MTRRIRKSFRNGRDSIANFQTNVAEKTRRAARKTDYYVHDNAWVMMAASAGLAFAAGFVLSKANQQMIAEKIGTEVPDSREKVKRLNSWEFVHSAIPLTLFLWKALQATRCARRV